MVAKQGWKIMTRPKTLVAKIFKERYVWRSLWKSSHFLKLGCRWNIGHGSNIKVMDNPWLNGKGCGWVSAPQPQSVYSLCVSDLMLDGAKLWDTHRISNLFTHDVAAEILMVPMSLLREVKEDRLVWKEEKDGEYQVRSGYRFLMTEKEEGRRRGTAGNWRSIWQIRAPPKAKHILWRICRDCLPTQTQLQQHCVQ
jgi:hypothetical protein